MEYVAGSALGQVRARRRGDSALISHEVAVGRLALKWERQPEPCHDYLQFLKKSRDESLLCTASSSVYTDIVTEIWDVSEKTILERIQTPNTQTSCMDWLSDNAFLTGGHDNTMTLWRDNHRAGQ